MNDSAVVVSALSSVVLILVLYVWMALALSALFRKAGEAGWQGWVPWYNLAVVLRLGGFSPWLIFINLVPLFGSLAYLVIHVMACYRINRAFGHGAGMTVVAALFFVVWASILGFGSSRWIGAAATGGPVRSNDDFGRDAASPMLPSDWIPREAPSPPPPPPAPAAVSSAAGAWAPPPPSAPSVGQAGAQVSPGPGFPPAAFPAPAFPVPAFPAPAFPDSAAEPAFPPPPPPVVAPTSGYDDEGDDNAVDPEDRVPTPAPLAGSFLPPPASPAREPEPRPESFAPIESIPVLGAPAAERPAPAPIVPVSAPPAPIAEPAPEPWAPTRSPAPTEEEQDSFPELSEAVSAVAGAPDAGAPRSARSSVSALYAQPELPDDDDALDQTIVARRRRVPWTLVPPGGAPVDISSEVVILGRRPSPDAAYPGAQLISISDETRTVSKTHARLELRGDTWFVTDLGSTNGVLFATLMGTEVEAQPGQELEAGERFFLGDAEVRLKRSEA